MLLEFQSDAEEMERLIELRRTMETTGRDCLTGLRRMIEGKESKIAAAVGVTTLLCFLGAIIHLQIKV